MPLSAFLKATSEYMQEIIFLYSTMKMKINCGDVLKMIVRHRLKGAEVHFYVLLIFLSFVIKKKFDDLIFISFKIKVFQRDLNLLIFIIQFKILIFCYFFKI